jgi:flagellar protein FlaG
MLNMDVNAIGNGVKVYNNAQYSNNTTTVNTPQVSGDRQDEKSQETRTRQEGNSVDKKELDKAIKKMNKFLEDDKTHAEYAVQKDLGTLMVKIVNDETKEVVLEVPSEKFLDMIAYMCKQVGLLDKKA